MAAQSVSRVGRVLHSLLKRSMNRHGKLDSEHYPDSQDVYQDFIERTQRHGFNKLGSGYFSVVFSHPSFPGLAFKFGLKKEDSGAAYAAWARANPGPHVPEILHAARYPHAYCVVMPIYGGIGDGHVLPQGAYNMLSTGSFKSQYSSYVSNHDAEHMTFYDTLLAIHRHFDGLAQFDLHNGNVMLASDGRYIITDPVSNSTK